MWKMAQYMPLGLIIICSTRTNSQGFQILKKVYDIKIYYLLLQNSYFYKNKNMNVLGRKIYWCSILMLVSVGADIATGACFRAGAPVWMIGTIRSPPSGATCNAQHPGRINFTVFKMESINITFSNPSTFILAILNVVDFKNCN